ncbi:MAG TPA: energy-coupling factor transporter transmembrane component T [bacterium]|nr:energy-coupling factor transporter transmembrane component T [bacterium]HQH80744.1 energy-coupling factor transporter transmembrane component T [bacterium]
MHHSFLDALSYSDGPLHGWDPRVKLMAALVTIFCTASTPFPRFGALAATILILMAISTFSKLPPLQIVKKISMVLPFVLIASISLIIADSENRAEILARLIFLIMKAAASVGALIILSSTTKFHETLKGMRWIGIPRIITALISFMYSFEFILIDEFQRLSTGRKSRDVAPGIILTWRSRAWMLGTFFIRSMERSARIHNAMLARGYCGEIKSFDSSSPVPSNQIAMATIYSAMLILIRSGVVL